MGIKELKKIMTFLQSMSIILKIAQVIINDRMSIVRTHTSNKSLSMAIGCFMIVSIELK